MIHDDLVREREVHAFLKRDSLQLGCRGPRPFSALEGRALRARSRGAPQARGRRALWKPKAAAAVRARRPRG